jgi:hypothetical protein
VVRNMVHMRSPYHSTQSFHSAAFVELRQSLPSQVQHISPFVDQLMRFIRRFRPTDGSEIDIEVAIREALANAVVHTATVRTLASKSTSSAAATQTEKSRSPFGTREQSSTPALSLIPPLPKAGCPNTVEVST